MLAWSHIGSIKRKIISFLPSNHTVLKNFFIYASGSLVLRSISLFLAPVTLTLLSPADYGLLALVQSFTNIFGVFLGLGLRQVFALEYFHHTRENRLVILHHIIGLYLLCALPLLYIMGLSASPINTHLFMGHADNTLIYLSLTFCFVYFFAELVYQTLQYQCRAAALTLLQITVALTTIACNIAALQYGLGLHGMLSGYILGMLLTCGYGIYRYTQSHRWIIAALKPTIKNVLYYLPLGLPFIPSVLCSWVLSSSSRWLLAQYTTLHDVGIYTLADTVGSVFQMLVLYPMSGSYLPQVLKKFNDNKNDVLTVEAWNKKNMWLCMAAAIISITAGYIIGKPVLHYFIPASYHAAFNYMWFILLTNILLMGTYFANALIQFHKRAYLLLIALSASALVNVCCGVLLIPRFKISGAIAALCLAYCCYFVITLVLNKHVARKLTTIQKH